MQAKQIAFFVVAFSLSMGIISVSGIFDYDPGNYEVNIQQNITEDIAMLDNSAESDNALERLVDGWEMLKQSYDALKTVFSVLLLPGPWLYSLGVSFVISSAVQTIVTLVELAGLVQFITNRSFKGME